MWFYSMSSHAWWYKSILCWLSIACDTTTTSHFTAHGKVETEISFMIEKFEAQIVAREQIQGAAPNIFSSGRDETVERMHSNFSTCNNSNNNLQQQNWISTSIINQIKFWLLTNEPFNVYKCFNILVVVKLLSTKFINTIAVVMYYYWLVGTCVFAYIACIQNYHQQ